MLAACGLVSVGGFGFSFFPQSGQSKALALAYAICLVLGLLQMQYLSDIPCGFNQLCFFVWGLLDPSIPASVSSVPRVSSC